jgi:hypothetical protein
MSNKQEKPRLVFKEVRRLEDSATQARFTWAVLFVPLVTVLVGLLDMIEPWNSEANPLFNGTISVVYFVLTIGMSYTFYAICHTSFIIDKLIRENETKAIQDFLKDYWNRRYSVIFCVNKENIVEFRTKTVIFLSVIALVASVLLLSFKLRFLESILPFLFSSTWQTAGLLR